MGRAKVAGSRREERASFGRTVRAARLRRDLTQGEVGAILGVRQTTVSQWEGDAAVPELPTLVDLAKTLGLDIGELVTEIARDQRAKASA
jgi:transcriptional regulator with XRE-family HTH domain